MLPRSSYSISFLLFSLLLLTGGNSMSSDESSESTLTTTTPLSTAITTTAAPCSNYSDPFNKLFRGLFSGIIECNSSKSATVFNVSLKCRDDSYLLELSSDQPFNISAGKIACSGCQDDVINAQLDIHLANGTQIAFSTVGDAYSVDDSSNCSPLSINSSSAALSFSFYAASYYNISAVNITVSKEDHHSNVTSWNLDLFQLTENIATAELARNVCSHNTSPPFEEKCCKNSVKHGIGDDERWNDTCPQCVAFEFPDLSPNSSDSKKLIFILEVYFHLCQENSFSNTSLSIFNRTDQIVMTNRFVMTQRDKNDTILRAIVMFWDLTPQDVEYLTVSGEAINSAEKTIVHCIYDDDTPFPSTKSPTETSAVLLTSLSTSDPSSVLSSSSSSSATTSSTTTASSSTTTTTTTTQSTITSLSLPASSTSTTMASSSSSSPPKPSSKASTTLPTNPTTPIFIVPTSNTSTTITTSSTSTPSSTSTVSSTSTTSTTENPTSTAPSVKTFSPDPFKLTNEEYTEELRDKNTAAYKRLRGTVLLQLSAICTQTIGSKFLNVIDMSFSRGSVIVNSTINITSDLSPDEKRQLNDAIKNGFKNSLNIVAVVVGSVVGLLFLIIVILLSILCYRQCRKRQRHVPPSSLSEPVDPTDCPPGPYVIRRPPQLIWQTSIGTSSLTRRGGGGHALELSAREAGGDGEKLPSPPPTQRTDQLRGAGSGIKGPAGLTHFAATRGDDRADAAASAAAAVVDWNGAIPRPGLDARLGGGGGGGQAHQSDSTKAFDYPFGPTAVYGGSWGLKDTSAGAEMVSGGGGVSDRRVLDGRVSSSKDRVHPGSSSSPLFCEGQAFFSGQTPIFQVTSSTPSRFEARLSKPVQPGPPVRDPHHPSDFEGLFVPVLSADGRSEFSRNSSSKNLTSHSNDDVSQPNAEKPGDGEFNWGTLNDGSSPLDDVLTHYGSKRNAPAQLLAIFQGTISRGSKPDNIHRVPPSTQPNKSRPQRTHETGPDSGV